MQDIEICTTRIPAVNQRTNNMSHREKTKKQCDVHSKFPLALSASYNNPILLSFFFLLELVMGTCKQILVPAFLFPRTVFFKV